MKLITLFLIAILALVQGNHDYLKGSKVFTVRPTTKKDRLIIGGLEQNVEGIDVWQYPHVSGREGRILVLKKSLERFETILRSSSIQYDVFIEDPKSMIENEIEQHDLARMRRGNGRISFTSYNRHDEINAYLDDLAEQYPSRVTVETAAITSNGRDMKVITISSNGGNDPSKPVIVIDAGIHAREWIAPSVALYTITKLVEDITESDVADNIDWVIFPVLNPDGYEYSHTNNRLWRKTRSVESSSTCPGVDGNRNFDFHWMESGASSIPCLDTFAGPRAFSEPETTALRDAINKYGDRVKAYLAVHSHGSYFLYPNGYDGSDPSNVEELHELGIRVAEAIEALALPGATKYLVGNSATALNYAAAGASDDWAMGVGGISLSYTLELPSGGLTGFDLPPSRIEQVVKETWGGILVYARYVLNKVNNEKM